MEERRMGAIELAPRITVDPAVRAGKAVIRGTRIDVELILGLWASGSTSGDLAASYGISPADVEACAALSAAWMAGERVHLSGGSGELAPGIGVDAEGVPVVSGTAVPVVAVLDALGAGRSPAELAAALRIPEGGHRACLRYAAGKVRDLDFLHLLDLAGARSVLADVLPDGRLAVPGEAGLRSGERYLATLIPVLPSQAGDRTSLEAILGERFRALKDRQ
jgi:uncharacterized protein (DUF433 family)